MRQLLLARQIFPLFMALYPPELSQECHGRVGHLQHDSAGHLADLHLVRLGLSGTGLAEVEEL